MKKTLIIGFLFAVIGSLLGIKIYKYNYNSLNEVASSNNNYYFLQEGVYEQKDNLNNALKKLDQKIVTYKNNKYYVYVGITKNKNTVSKLKKIYQKKGLNLTEKVQTINNEEFLNNVLQFDSLIASSSTEDEILTIEEVILANYDEIIQN